MRGGGGSFGVVTALEFRMYDIPTAYAGMLIWDLARHRAGAARVGRLGARRPGRGHHVVPRACGCPPMPELPDFLRGRQLVVIDGAVLGSDERGAELLAGLRALRPELDTFARVPAKSLVRLHMDPEGGAPVVSDSAMLGVASRTPRSTPSSPRPARTPTTSLLMAELRQLGGALGRPHEGGGVLTASTRSSSPSAVAMARHPRDGRPGARRRGPR